MLLLFQENERMKENMKGDNMKVGIIGCGKIAQVRHIPEYLENPDVEIVGYYDWNADQRNLAARHIARRMNFWQTRRWMLSVSVWQITHMQKLRSRR